jgi:hypothetical protein
MAVVMPIDDGREIPAAGDALLQGTHVSAVQASSPEMGDTAMAPQIADMAITLAFEDLLPDANGEIVVMGDGFGTQLSILTDQRICAEGFADSHVTADGLDVAGLAYFAFEGGTKLYYSPEIEVTIAPVHG